MAQPLVAPPAAMGWTHIWDNAEQLAISDEVAAALVCLGIIWYTGSYRVYALHEDWTIDKIRSEVLRDM